MGLKITNSEDGSIKISNHKLTCRLLVTHGLEKCNATHVPYQVSVDLSGPRDRKGLVDKSAYQRDVGVLLFVADTIRTVIAWMLGMLGRHLDNPAKRHADTVKPVLQYLGSQQEDGDIYKANVPLILTWYTNPTMRRT